MMIKRILLTFILTLGSSCQYESNTTDNLKKILLELEPDLNIDMSAERVEELLSLTNEKIKRRIQDMVDMADSLDQLADEIELRGDSAETVARIRESAARLRCKAEKGKPVE